MGWSSGSDLMGSVISAIESRVKDKEIRRKIYVDIIEAFRMADCDTLGELEGEDPAFDKALFDTGELEL